MDDYVKIEKIGEGREKVMCEKLRTRENQCQLS